MKLIRGRNTKPELAAFELLIRAGLRISPHERVCGITVDALVEDRVVVFVDSPFWHLRDPEELKRLSPHWQDRLRKNKARDRRQTRLLRQAGYSVVRIWADQVSLEGEVVRRVGRVLSRSGRSAAVQ